MNEKEKALLILKAKFSDNEDLKNRCDILCQLKKPEVLLTTEEAKLFNEYAQEWSNKGWIIYTGIAPLQQVKYLEDVDNVTEGE
jgi:hypothetical protein